MMTVQRCAHCSNPISNSKPNLQFCCNGCEYVYNLLHHQGLETFYTLKNQPLEPLTETVTIHPKDHYLDEPHAKQRYIWTEDARHFTRFYIKGLHCGACIWLLEQLPTIDPQIIRSKLNFGQSNLTLEITPTASLAKITSLLRTFGYYPMIQERFSDQNALWKQERRDLLVKIGVAGFLSGNIMLLSISLYGGALGIERTIFEWMSFGLSLPIALWLALPFYKRGFSGLLTKEINIDLPVTIAILGGFLLSTWSLLIGQHHIYYDSIAMFAFLLLCTRFLLKSIHHAHTTSGQDLAFRLPEFATLLSPNPTYIPTKDIPIGALIRVDANQIIPIDGILQSDTSYIDTHLLTGESYPQKHLKNDPVFALTTNLSSPILIKTTTLSSQNRLSQMLAKVHATTKPPLAILSDQISKWFVFGIFLLSIVSGSYKDLSYLLGLIMVACPCALALTTPLIYTLGIKKAASIGLLIKDADVFDRLKHAQTFFFDKTGTLTHGQLAIEKIHAHTPTPLDHWIPIILSLEHTSRHPIARILCRHFHTTQPLPTIQNHLEILGQGISGEIDQKNYFIGKTKTPTQSSPHTTISLYENNQPILEIFLSDTLKKDAKETLQTLRAHHKKPTLISGDSDAVTKAIATSLDHTAYFANASPEKKYEIIKSTPGAVMIGDGANDALALATASIGIAVQGALEDSLQTASVYIADHKLTRIIDLLKIAAQVRRTILLIVGISVTYNVIGITLVLTGHITPLIAAILMPISSLTITLIGIWQIKRTPHQ